jgi:hypothetical protein
MTTKELENKNQRDWIELEHKYYQATFKRQPVAFVRGEGPRVYPLARQADCLPALSLLFISNNAV